jgi:hypothetical protein
MCVAFASMDFEETIRKRRGDLDRVQAFMVKDF